MNTTTRTVTALRIRPGCIGPRRHAVLRFRNVWAARLARHEDDLLLAYTFALGAFIGIGIMVVMLLAQAWQRGLV